MAKQRTEISDIGGVKVPITRLIEVLQAGLGVVFEPYVSKRTANKINLIRKEIESAKVPVTYRDSKISVSNTLSIAKKLAVIAQDDPEEGRALERLCHQEKRHQRNIENVAGFAAERLAGLEAVPLNAPTIDWVDHFFESAKGITEKNMQSVWGKILAGEIQEPGTFSRRTLSCVKNISSSEAAFFQKLSTYIISIDRERYPIIVMGKNDWLVRKKNLSTSDLRGLSEARIIFDSPTVLDIASRSRRKRFVFSTGSKGLTVEKGTANISSSLNIWEVTSVGAELLRLVDRKPDIGYLEWVGRHYSAAGYNVFLVDIGKQTNHSGKSPKKKRIKKITHEVSFDESESYQD